MAHKGPQRILYRFRLTVKSAEFDERLPNVFVEEVKVANAMDAHGARPRRL